MAIVALVGVTLDRHPAGVPGYRGKPPLGDGRRRYVVDEFALALKGLFVASGHLVLLMSVSYIESERYCQGEYYFLLLSPRSSARW